MVEFDECPSPVLGDGEDSDLTGSKPGRVKPGYMFWFASQNFGEIWIVSGLVGSVSG